MDIHKPKAAHNLREFAIEIGTIVTGIIIALALEQAVEGLHWSHRVHEAESAMNAELSQNIQDAYFRMAVEPCGKRDLDRIEGVLVASRDQGTPAPIISPYRRPLRPWQSDAWESARSLQITSHISSERLTQYSQAYFFPAILRASQPREREAMSEINSLAVNAGRLQAAERDRLFLALTRARDADREMTNAAWLAIRRTKVLGLEVSANEQATQLAAAHADYGDCVAAPDLAKSPM